MSLLILCFLPIKKYATDPITGAKSTATSQMSLFEPVNSFFRISMKAKMNGINPIKNKITIISKIPIAGISFFIK